MVAPDGAGQIIERSIDGSYQRTVTTGDATKKIALTVSPDGNWVAYQEYGLVNDAPQLRIVVVNRRTGKERYHYPMAAPRSVALLPR